MAKRDPIAEVLAAYKEALNDLGGMSDAIATCVGYLKNDRKYPCGSVFVCGSDRESMVDFLWGLIQALGNPWRYVRSDVVDCLAGSVFKHPRPPKLPDGSGEVAAIYSLMISSTPAPKVGDLGVALGLNERGDFVICLGRFEHTGQEHRASGIN